MAKPVKIAAEQWAHYMASTVEFTTGAPDCRETVYYLPRRVTGTCKQRQVHLSSRDGRETGNGQVRWRELDHLEVSNEESTPW